MKRFASALLCVVVCSGFAVSNAAAETKVKVQPPPPDYFPLKADYWWKYDTEATTGASGFTLKVVGVEKKDDGTVEYDLHTEPRSAVGSTGFDEWYAKPKGLVLTLRFKFGPTLAEYSPPRKYLENPLTADSQWNWTGMKMHLPCTENSKVEAVEDVEVPAGKFKAMRVSTTVVQGGAPVIKTYWYAPWVGLVQSRTVSGDVVSTSRLADYSFKKPETDDPK